jgi:hypothetical protein
MFDSMKVYQDRFATRIDYENNEYGFTQIVFWSGNLQMDGQPQASYHAYQPNLTLEDIIYKEKLGIYRRR